MAQILGNKFFSDTATGYEMKARVTLKDIAREAGVHTSTVSRALDPNSKTSLTDDVANRIKDAAKRLGYRPNRIAAGLRTSRTMSVGVMIPDITNTLFPPFVRGIESVLEPKGYTSILVNTDNIAERERRQIDVLRERGVDGIISGAVRLDDPGLAEAAEQGVPIVTWNRRIEKSPIPYVVNDERSGFRMIVEHLFELGHRRIGFISGPQNLSTGLARRIAVEEMCRTLGIDLNPNAIAEATQYVEAEGQRCALEILARDDKVTALICANDRLAIGAYAGLRELGRKIPDDISVTGFNDNPTLELIPPRLTTVRIQQFGAGRICAEILLRMIEGEKAVSVGTVLPVELVMGESTARSKSTAALPQ